MKSSNALLLFAVSTFLLSTVSCARSTFQDVTLTPERQPLVDKADRIADTVLAGLNRGDDPFSEAVWTFCDDPFNLYDYTRTLSENVDHDGRWLYVDYRIHRPIGILGCPATFWIIVDETNGSVVEISGF